MQILNKVLVLVAVFVAFAAASPIAEGEGEHTLERCTTFWRWLLTAVFHCSGADR